MTISKILLLLGRARSFCRQRTRPPGLDNGAGAYVDISFFFSVTDEQVFLFFLFCRFEIATTTTRRPAQDVITTKKKKNIFATIIRLGVLMVLCATREACKPSWPFICFFFFQLVKIMLQQYRNRQSLNRYQFLKLPECLPQLVFFSLIKIYI